MLKYVNHDIVFQEFPDEVTLAINLSRCPNGCPGCHSAYLQGDVGEELTAERLMGLVDTYAGEVTCVGFMGGDNDPATVLALCQAIKSAYGDRLRTGWYSGRERLPEAVSTAALDYLKLGPYRAACGPLKARSTNQRLYRLRAADGTMDDITSRFWR
ncbi:MAG: anaerobic ribonucleoside-triphosphate reductase activating protein [Bacteroidales bacterium]|nr:anaerobic ribonucleoside-triphosphate reductase activating protein [Bacteroidales bacterium]